ncbi:MAG: membrane protein [Candidatus Cloacimonadota bacterium]|nr:MAG: membrane protein [Candidatus Cloacimonadota bacterium]
MNKKLKRNIIQHLGIVAGSILFAIAYSWFLVPYKIIPGGIGGLGQILFHFLNIPIGVSMIMFNVPLFILSFVFLGKRFGQRSLFGMFTTSILADFLSFKNLYNFGIIKDLTPYTFMDHGKEVYAMLSPQDIYLSAITGSVLLGLGLGIIFRFRGSTGGTDIPVAFLKQKTGISIGMGYWVVETIIIMTIGIVFKDMKLIIWGYVNLFITTKLTDLASEGLPYVKGVYIISEKNNEIKEKIYDKIRRGVTFFKAQGGYTGDDFNVLFCAMNRRQVAMMRDIVKDIDPTAFVLLTDVNDVMGYGFRSRNIDLSDKSSS